MDNVTHSLIGVLLAHVLSGRRATTRAAVCTGIIGSNLPDADLVLRPFFADEKLGYLLHHRGYTHTALAAIPLAFAAAAIGVWLGRDTSREDRGRLLGLAFVALALHMGADAWNNYGIHPFSPFWDRWFYGDFIFIVEPLLWMALLPFAFLSTGSRLVKALWAMLGLSILGLAWGLPMFDKGVATALTGWAALNVAVQVKRRGPAPPAVAALAVLIAFAIAGPMAREQVEATLRLERLIEVGVTPAPANPLCWQAIALSVAGDGTYIARTALVSLAPRWVDPARCEIRNGDSRTAPASPTTGVDAPPGIAWQHTFQGSLDDLRRLASSDCRAAAALRFARSPFWTTQEGRTVIGDLRYDFEPELGFAEIALGPDAPPCPEPLPPWMPESTKALLGSSAAPPSTPSSPRLP